MIGSIYSRKYGGFNEAVAAKYKDVMKTLLQGLYMDRHEFWAREVDESIKGLGTDERKLIYLVVLMNDEDVKQVQQRYKKVFKKDMLQQIGADIA